MEKEFGTVPDYETGRNGYAHILVALGRLKPQTLGSERSGGEDGGVISCWGKERVQVTPSELVETLRAAKMKRWFQEEACWLERIPCFNSF